MLYLRDQPRAEPRAEREEKKTAARSDCRLAEVNFMNARHFQRRGASRRAAVHHALLVCLAPTQNYLDAPIICGGVYYSMETSSTPHIRALQVGLALEIGTNGNRWVPNRGCTADDPSIRSFDFLKTELSRPTCDS
ncbi:hypothetical protein EVAR_68229_1 [Eumeta japonica]|uniref:Uncharacterized protein n=1 Tax=Eumeta variegata TaxID=151549 RepID=A0A4C2AD76_EUMVA|nr:hypothetical protein EVAR_68229_1 [Eumeta japonica]